MEDLFRIIFLVGAVFAIILYARAAVQYKNRQKGGLPAAYAPANLAVALALVIGITDQSLRLHHPLTWRAYAYGGLVILTHWALYRMGISFGRSRTPEGVSAQTARIMQQIAMLGEAVFAVDADGRCRDVNGIGINLLGYGRNEMVGQDMHELTHYKKLDGTPIPKEHCALTRALNTGKSVLHQDTVLWDRDGQPVHCVFSATPVIEDGKVTGGVVVFSEKAGTFAP